MNSSDHSYESGFGNRLRVAIRRTWKSQKALAEHLGMSEQSLSRYTRGRGVPAGGEMAKLAQALPGQIEWILTGKEHGAIRLHRPRSEIRAELDDFLDEIPDLVLERILWQAKALYTLGKIGKEAFQDYARQVRGE